MPIPNSGAAPTWAAVARNGPADVWQLFLNVVVAAVVAAEGFRLAQSGFSNPGGLAALAAMSVAVALRIRAPAASLAASAVLTVVLQLQTGANLPGWCLLQVCLLSFAIVRPRAQAVAGTIVVGFILVTESALWLHVPPSDPLSLALMAWTTAAGGVGAAVHSERAYVNALEEQSRRVLATREAVVARRLAEERVRIARELHDVIAHHIAAINVHAGSAEVNALTDAVSTKQSLVRIRTSTREVLHELRAILHVLRTDDLESDVDKPAPGVLQIPLLIESFRSLGLQVRCQETAVPQMQRTLPAAVNLALYRITQEALTNVHKHGRGAAWLDFETSESGLAVRIRNETRTVAVRDSSRGAPGEILGFGLVGMRERATSAGGELRVIRIPGQFTIEAVFPTEAKS
jgi:signal transduction histidine kinase